MSPDSYQLFNTWFPAIVVGLVISLLAAALWDILRRKTWCFAARFWPGLLHEVGLDNSCLSRVEVEEKQREVTDMLSALSSQITKALVSGKSLMAGNIDSTSADSSNSESSVSLNCDSDIEAQPTITPTGKSITFMATAYFPDDTPIVIIRPVKKFFKRYSKGTVKRWKSSIVLQASLPIEPCVLAKIGVLAKSCMHDENRCIFQLDNWAILYYNAGEVHVHILKEGDVPVNVEARWEDERTTITMRGLYLNGAQVKVATKQTSTTLRSDGPATQRPGELDELHFPSGELDVPGEDLLIFAAKIVEADGISLIVRSEASFIHPQRGNFALAEVIWGLLRRIPQCAKTMTQLFLKDEDRQPETTDNWPELRFDQEHRELIVEHWKGVSEIELLENRNEILHYLQELRVSGIVDGASSQPPVSHLNFIRDGHYVEYWQRGLQDLNEVILQNTGGPHPGRHISIRGGIKFLLGDFESALQDFDLANLNTGEHRRTALFERALVKCLLARYAEALQDVVAVISINPNLNDIQELQRYIHQILGLQRSFGSAESGPLSQRPKLFDQDNPMVKIPDLLTGDEWRSGWIESPRTMSDDITGRGLIVDRSSMHAKSTDLAQPRDVAMAFKVDTSPIKLQLKLMNYAESLERKPRYHVRRISFIANIFEGGWGTDDVVELLSAEDQKVLHWKAGTGNLQDDVEVRSELTYLSGRLCPYKNISLSLFDKVSDYDTHQQWTGQYPVSSYRHLSFRSAMLTKHRATDGETELLFLYDGLPGDLSQLRWRSHHEYIKLDFFGARPSYRVFWLVQWDVVDMSEHISDGLDATTGRGIINRRSCLDHPALQRQGDSTSEFHGIRRREKRKFPWIAEVTPEGLKGRKKICLGRYKTAEAAARAADAGFHYYNLQNRFNFPDSPSFLKEIPGDLSDTDMQEFVIEEARRLVSVAVMPSLTSVPDNRSYNSISEGLPSSQPLNIDSGYNFGSDNMHAAANANFAGLPRSDSFLPPSMESGRDVKANQYVQPSTSNDVFNLWDENSEIVWDDIDTTEWASDRI